ncbi:MAG: response regulator transcription factor [Stackebrandtia sp.]
MWSSSLVSVLSREPDLQVIADATSTDDILDAVSQECPDVVVLALYLTGVDGVGELCRRLCDGAGEHRVLVLHERNTPLMDAFRLTPRVSLMSSGVSPEQFLDCVRQIACGHLIIDSEMAIGMLRANYSPLTAREREVLRLTGAGAAPKEIATRLRLSVGTVRNYLSNASSKLGARNRIDAIRIAEGSGWI